MIHHLWGGGVTIFPRFLLWSWVSEDNTTRRSLSPWPFPTDLTLYNTSASIAVLLFSLFFIFWSSLLMRDQNVFVYAGWQSSSMFTTPEGEASLSQNRWGGLAGPPSPLPPPPSRFKHPDWAKALEQQAYRVARSLGISWGDPLSFRAQNRECEAAVSLVAEQQLPFQTGLTILVCCFGTVTTIIYYVFNYKLLISCVWVVQNVNMTITTATLNPNLY